MQMCVIQCIGSNSTTWFNTAVLVTCMRNFPHSRGTVVGILKGLVALSAAIFAQIYTSLLTDDTNMLLLFLTLVPTVVCLGSMAFVRPVPAAGNVRDPEESHYFHYVTAVCVALAGYLLAVNLTEEFVKTNRFTAVIFAAIMVMFLIAPLAIPIKTLSAECCGISPIGEDTPQGIQKPLLKETNETNISSSHSALIIRGADEDGAYGRPVEGIMSPRQSNPSALHHEEKGKKVTLHEDIVAKLSQEEDAETLLVVGEGAVKRPKRKPRRGEDFNLRQALVKADFWILFFTFFCGVGTGVTAINNLGQIAEAQGYHNVNIFVSLISIANFLGRLGGGSLSEHHVRYMPFRHAHLSNPSKQQRFANPCFTIFSIPAPELIKWVIGCGYAGKMQFLGPCGWL